MNVHELLEDGCERIRTIDNEQQCGNERDCRNNDAHGIIHLKVNILLWCCAMKH
jgi:hypothetical protein